MVATFGNFEYAATSISLASAYWCLTSAKRHANWAYNKVMLFVNGSEHVFVSQRSQTSRSRLFQELYNDPAELSRFFQIHQMAHTTDHHASGSRYTCLDGACMRMNIRNVSVTNK